MANYFDEQVWAPILVNYNQQTEEWRLSPEGQKVANDMMIAFTKIIQGIIFTHKFTRFASYDDCLSIAYEAVWKALPKYDPEYINFKGNRATVFNFISLVSKKVLIYSTMRMSKLRERDSNQQFEDLSCEDSLDFTQDIEDRDYVEKITSVMHNVVDLKYHSRMKSDIRKELHDTVDILFDSARAMRVNPLPSQKHHNIVTQHNIHLTIMREYPHMKPVTLRRLYKIMREYKDYILSAMA